MSTMGGATMYTPAMGLDMVSTAVLIFLDEANDAEAIVVNGCAQVDSSSQSNCACL